MTSDVGAFLAYADTDARLAVDYQVPRFLSGFVIKHAPAFDEWVAGKRQQLLRRHQEAMLTVARDAMARWRWHDAAVLADRILDTDPLSDDAARMAAEAWFMSGDRGEALARCGSKRMTANRTSQFHGNGVFVARRWTIP